MAKILSNVSAPTSYRDDPASKQLKWNTKVLSWMKHDNEDDSDFEERPPR